MQELFKSVLVGEVDLDGTTGLWKGVHPLGRAVGDSSEFNQTSG